MTASKNRRAAEPATKTIDRPAEFDADGILTCRGIRIVDELGRLRIRIGMYCEQPSVTLSTDDLDTVDNPGAEIQLGVIDANPPSPYLSLFQNGDCVWSLDDGGLRDDRPGRAPALNPPVEDCPCLYGDTWHDWLLALEERGLAGVVELTERLRIAPNQDGPLRRFTVWDLPAFVARHNWQDPTTVSRLAAYIVNAERDHHHLPVVEAAS
jgi:hypothetical protein